MEADTRGRRALVVLAYSSGELIPAPEDEPATAGLEKVLSGLGMSVKAQAGLEVLNLAYQFGAGNFDALSQASLPAFSAFADKHSSFFARNSPPEAAEPTRIVSLKLAELLPELRQQLLDPQDTPADFIRLGCVELLREVNLEPEKMDGYVKMACEHKQFAIAQWLKGEAELQRGTELLIEACRGGDADRVGWVLADFDFGWLSAAPSTGRSCRKKLREAFLAVCEAGSPAAKPLVRLVELPRSWMRKALEACCASGDLELVRLLCREQRVSKEEATADSDSALRTCLRGGRTDIAKWLAAEFGVADPDGALETLVAFSPLDDERFGAALDWLIAALDLTPDKMSAQARLNFSALSSLRGLGGQFKGANSGLLGLSKQLFGFAGRGAERGSLASERIALRVRRLAEANHRKERRTNLCLLALVGAATSLLLAYMARSS